MPKRAGLTERAAAERVNGSRAAVRRAKHEKRIPTLEDGSIDPDRLEQSWAENTRARADSPIWKPKGFRLSTSDPTPPTGASEVAAVNRLWPVARAALDADRFDLVEEELRAALRAVPLEDRDGVDFDLAVMKHLVADAVAALLAVDEPAFGNTAARVPVKMSDEELELMATFWYSVAAEEPIDWDKF